jgi:hypothetical protein
VTIEEVIEEEIIEVETIEEIVTMIEVIEIVITVRNKKAKAKVKADLEAKAIKRRRNHQERNPIKAIDRKIAI